jgi:hypothetical protein
MNLTVVLVTVLLAVFLGGALLVNDERVRRRITRLRAEGTVQTAFVTAYAVQHRKPVLVCQTDTGQKIVVHTYSDHRYHKGEAVQVRVASTKDQPDAELVDEPRRSIGRSVGIAVGVCILLLGLMLAALS